MKTPEYPFMPYSLRWSIAVAALAIAWVMWLFIFNGPGVPTATTATVGVCVMVAALLSLGVLASERSPFLPFWTSLGIVVVQSAMIRVSLIGRPTGYTPIILSAIVTLGVAGGILLRRRPRIAIGLLVVLGFVGLYLLALVPYDVLRYGGALVRNTGAPGGILGAACLAASWHALRARPAPYRPLSTAAL